MLEGYIADYPPHIISAGCLKMAFRDFVLSRGWRFRVERLGPVARKGCVVRAWQA